MKFLILSLFWGVVLGLSPEIAASFKKKPQILEPYEFWRVNGSLINEGKVYEVFYPPLKPVDK